MGFEVVPHTADLAVKVWGRDLAELFGSALDGYRFFLIGDRVIEWNKVQTFSIEADDPESLLVRFLNRLIFLFDTESFLPASAKLKIAGNRLDVEVSGSNDIQDIRHCVKAATYHNLSIVQTEGILWATVIFDD